MIHIRSSNEVEKIRLSCRIVTETLDIVGGMIAPGVTPRALDSAAEAYIRRQGGEPGFKGLYGYPATLCVSVEDAVVHGIPDDTPLKEGQIVSIDVGAIKDSYYGDHARTFAVGAVDKDRQRLMDRTRECLDLGVRAAAVGNHVGDIGHAVQQHAEGAGFGVVRELVGHGIGTRLHEEPQVPNFGRPGFGVELREGMCLAIEPMINMGTKEIFTRDDGWTVCTSDGKPSAHFEHTIVVTANGPEILTKYETT
ncbi:MAG: type I methionyl aminopeptidase [Fidelibacterota bacterium]|nr:MAG: type I methionyl aminopeptidase [Candidatus Neomarinimicrobiota bacterium]